ncbi:MAG TPA: NAD(P)-dependent oxidoreductase [Microthrixaceae bacterium]|nr:NAD(P)-dependent oxidoreductase [Microthrixaceae bacterium]
MSGRALITGGAGFIGAHLSRRLLDDGWEVTLVDNLSRGVEDTALVSLRERPGFALHVADLRDPSTLGSIPTDHTHVLHFAALLGVQNVIDRPSAVLRENVALLETMLDVASAQSCLERFLFPSTSEVYAGTQQFHDLPFPTPEDTPLTVSALDRPRTSYMLSKIYGEALVHHSGLPFTIVRPHNFYGPRMGLSHVVPQLLDRIHRSADGDELTVYSIDHNRTFCFIDDAVEYLTRLMGPAGRDGTFNIGVEAPEVTIGELAELLCRVVGRELRLVAGETTAGSPPRRCPDMSRTIDATGHRPQVSLDEGVTRTYSWYRDTVFDGDGVSAR